LVGDFPSSRRFSALDLVLASDAASEEAIGGKAGLIG